MTRKILLLALTALINAYLLAQVETAIDQSAILLYGKVTTTTGEKFTGQLRWGKEEAFWFDYFNSSKIKNENLKLLSDEQLEELDEKEQKKSWFALKNKWRWNYSSSYSNNNHHHSFACQFGDIKKIQPGNGEKIKVTLQNGDILKLDGGSNDVGATVRIHDADEGLIKMGWDKIEMVEFFSAPRNFESQFGKPLYGKVKTSGGTFEGYVQWDHDERLSEDELNGDMSSGEIDLPFGKIKTITKTYKGVEVKVLSGRTFDLTGSNDVDDDNRGIIVNMPEMGRVDIPWEEFHEVTFFPAQDISEVFIKSAYSPEKITGTVYTVDGISYTGLLIYDLDEIYDLEILNGYQNDLEFFLPFRNITSIEPKSDDTALVKLHNGEIYRLEDKVDVSEENDGILVTTSHNEQQYISWRDVKEIKINGY